MLNLIKTVRELQITYFCKCKQVKMSKRPLILVTNDDGILAPGIRNLIHIMNSLGEVIVVAPDSPQSAMGHAITIDKTLFCKKEQIDNGPQKEYSTSGTPADCIKLAVHELLDRKPDLCVSGINHGSNSSINVIYSGTMSAAIEAGMCEIPAIGFSLLNYNWDADFSAAESYIKTLCLKVLKKGLQKGIVLNVNFPNLAKKDIKGLKVCRQANANWIEKFDKRQSPMGRSYYWLTGEFINHDKGKDTDEWALKEGYISVVPVQFDLTAHQYLSELNDWDLNG